MTKACAPARPRRVAFVIDAVMPWNKGGREMILDQVCGRLVGSNQEVHVYTMKWWAGPQVIERGGVYFHAICRQRPLYRNSRRSTGQALWFAVAVFKLLFERFDALHVDHMPFFPLYSARVVAWLKGRRLTATWHEVWGRDYWLCYMGGPAGFVGELMERASFRLPDAIASDSELTTKRLQAAGVACPIETVPLGVDVKAIAAAPAAETQSDVIYVGRLIEHKGVDLLVRAASNLRVARPDLRVLIVGSGPESENIKRLVRDLDLTRNIRLLGEIASDQTVHGLMKSSKLLVLPSRREGFGLVVLEGNAAGLPVVTLRCDDNAAVELIREGVNGFLCEPTTSDLADKIALTLENRARMRPTEEIGRYDWNFVARQMDGFLRGGLTKRSA